ncbi:O-antigen ligase family protein, partial [Balneolaceae bacterium ANBcel3]|nr:O-antigen ligase family protein [Balneolaceae bacterium ANBcel3]
DIMSDGTRLASRVRIGQVDPNVFASLFFLPLAFTASISFSKTHLSLRLISSVIFLILFAAVLLTFSRSSWVSLIFMVIVLAFLYRQYNLFLTGFVFFGLLLLLFPELRFIFISIASRFLGLFTGSVDTSNFIRILLVHAALGMFFNSWLIGVGWRGFPDHIFNYFSYQQTMGVYEPHNVVYLVFAELGLVGLLLFCYIVFKIFHLAWQNIHLSHGVEQKALAHALFGAFLAYAIFYQFIGSGFLDNQLWITTGLILALNFSLKKNHDN